MKTIIRLVTIGATVALLAFPAVASSLSTDTIAQDQCTDENKANWYKTFLTTYKPDQDQAKAYEIAKTYLAACPTDETPQTQFVKKWFGLYEKAMRGTTFQKLLYTEKKYPEAFKLGGEILKDEPDNVKILMDLGFAGYQNSTKNPPFNAEALGYARKAIQLIESGKTLDNWTPFPNKDEALAFLTYYIALDTLQKDPVAALPLLIKAAKFESSLKKSPVTYERIAAAYENGPYAKLEADYKAKFGGQNESPEQKLALANLDQLVDRMIDAYARAVALAASDTTFAAQKKAWTETLTNYYKYRNNKSETGLPELIAGILSKPLPPEPTPLTSLPVSAPTATPSSGNGASAQTGTPAPGTNTASNSGSTTNPKPTTPATTTNTPTKPAPKRPQRR